MSSGIYAIQCQTNDRKYIGSSINTWKRWIRHRSDLRRGVHHSLHLQRAWDKYGEDFFEFVVLEECPIEQLLEREQHYLDLYSDKYNCVLVAGSCLGYRHTPEDLERISAAMRGNKNPLGHVHSSASRAKMSASHTGHEVSEAARSKLRAANTGHKHTDEARANMSVAQKGHTVSQEQRAKVSAALKGRKFSPETIERMSAAQTGHRVSDETRAKISATQKARWERRRASVTDNALPSEIH